MTTLRHILPTSVNPERNAVYRALQRIGPDAAEVVPDLLEILSHYSAEENENSPALHSLVKIDPQGKACRRIVRQWHDSDDDDLRQQAKRQRETVHLAFGDPIDEVIDEPFGRQEQEDGR